MNRAERRRRERENRGNSEKNYQYDIETIAIPLELVQHNPNLNEPDKDIVELCQHVNEWQDKNLVKQVKSKCLIMTGTLYLDSLCALRFGITPADNKVLIRNTMYYICNMVNVFLGGYINALNNSLFELLEEAKSCKRNYLDMPVPEDAETYPMCPLPDRDAVDDLYARLVVGRAIELLSCLISIKPFEVSEDEEYVFEVLNMIVKKTKELLPEVEVDSESFIVEVYSLNPVGGILPTCKEE